MPHPTTTTHHPPPVIDGFADHPEAVEVEQLKAKCLELKAMHMKEDAEKPVSFDSLLVELTKGAGDRSWGSAGVRLL